MEELGLREEDSLSTSCSLFMISSLKDHGWWELDNKWTPWVFFLNSLAVLGKIWITPRSTLVVHSPFQIVICTGTSHQELCPGYDFESLWITLGTLWRQLKVVENVPLSNKGHLNSEVSCTSQYHLTKRRQRGIRHESSYPQACVSVIEITPPSVAHTLQRWEPNRLSTEQHPQYCLLKTDFRAKHPLQSRVSIESKIDSKS